MLTGEGHVRCVDESLHSNDVFTDLSVGFENVCGVTVEGELICCGTFDDFQINL